MTTTLTPPSRIHGSAPVSREPATPSSVTKVHAASKLRSLLSMRELPVIAALIALVLLTWVMNPRFLSAQGVRDLFLNATIAMLMAAGQSLIIQSEGVDLSVGSILGCTAFATGFLFADCLSSSSSSQESFWGHCSEHSMDCSSRRRKSPQWSLPWALSTSSEED